MYIAYTLGENDFKDPYMIGVFYDLDTCKIFLEQFMKSIDDYPIFLIKKVKINTINKIVEESFFYKMDLNDIMNPIQANTFKELLDEKDKNKEMFDLTDIIHYCC